MNESYSYSRPTDQLLGFDDVDKNYKVSHSMNTKSTDTCPNCKKKLVTIERDGYVCCKKCGMVLDKTIFGGEKEWTEDDGFRLNEEMEGWSSQYSDTPIDAHHARTTIGNDEDPSRVYDGSKKGKKIHRESKHGKALAKLREESKKTHGKKHLRSWDEWNQRFTDLLNKTLPGRMTDANALAQKIVDKNIADTAILLFRKCLRKELQKGQHNLLVMASCIRLARKLHGLEIDFDSIDNDLGWRVKNFQMYYKIKSELDIKFNDYENELVYKNVHEITTKICNVNEFEEENKIFNDALNIIKTASKKGITGGKVPENVAAAAVFLACIKNGYEISHYDMAKNVKPSSATIKQIAKELTDGLITN